MFLNLYNMSIISTRRFCSNRKVQDVFGTINCSKDCILAMFNYIPVFLKTTVFCVPVN